MLMRNPCGSCQAFIQPLIVAAFHITDLIITPLLRFYVSLKTYVFRGGGEVWIGALLYMLCARQSGVAPVRISFDNLFYEKKSFLYK